MRGQEAKEYLLTSALSPKERGRKTSRTLKGAATFNTTDFLLSFLLSLSMGLLSLHGGYQVGGVMK
jgi:hypothetical protein